MMRPYQKRLHDEVLAALEKHPRAVLNGTCGSGKTYITLCMIAKWLSEGKRILVSTFSHTDIKLQWLNEISKHKGIDKNILSVLVPKGDKSLGKGGDADSVFKTADNSYESKLVITIPQTAFKNAHLLGRFDIIIVDEAYKQMLFPFR